MQIIEGGVTAAKGFKAAGMAAGIKYKNGKKDMAMVVSDKPCVTAGTFTLNRVLDVYKRQRTERSCEWLC